MEFETFKNKFNKMLDDRETFHRLNKLARKFYKVMGYEVRESYDFSASKDTRALMCYRMAEIAFEEFVGDKPNNLEDE
jgi:regulator of RNase E activity RraB